MRVLVCGHRHFADYSLMETTLKGLHITEIIEGGAKGADTLARLYGEKRGIPVKEFRADWARHGKAAGPIRNKRMLLEGRPVHVVAFLAADSVGTRNMISQARKAGIPVQIVALPRGKG